MNQQKRVIVTTDGSTHSLRVLPHAGAFAKAVGGEVILLRVLDDGDDLTPESGESKDAAIARTEVKVQMELTRELKQHGVEGTGVVVWTEVREDVASAIVRTASQMGGGLIAMDARGTGFLRAALFGSTTQSVLSKTELPLMISGPNLDMAITDDYRLVVASDGSHASTQVVRVLAPILEGTSVKVTLMRVYEPVSGHRDEAVETAECERQLTELRTLLPASLDVDIFVRKIVPMGGIDTAIQEKADESGANAIALSTHGHGGRRALVMGSLAHTLVDRAGLPVILARVSE